MVCCRFPSISGMAAAPIRVQAWGGAVGWVRNVSPIGEDWVFKIAGFVLAFCENFARASRALKRILRLRHPASVLRLN
jgi:hypothetical protein